jgi:membrane protein YdbS with pleckstrin-like domain
MKMSNAAQNSVATSTGSWPIATILTIIFVVLKLTEVIDWSWWWVLSPLWISCALSIAVLLFIFIGYIIYYLVKGKDE